MRHLKIFLALTKYKIALLSTLSGILGFYLKQKSLSGIFFVFLSLYLLASGSLALNQYVERDIDEKMERTKKRPIVRGNISPLNALFISITLVISGILILFLKFGLLSSFLGFLTFFIYIFIYTPLKRKTPFAFLPGSIIGAIPPLTGWVSAGGKITSPLIIVISTYFFIWQIPHFLILFYYMSDDYKKAGLKTIKDVFSETEIKVILTVWISATLLLTFSFPFFGVVKMNYVYFLFSLYSLLILLLIFIFLKKLENSKKIFHILNFYTFSMILVLMMSNVKGL